MLHRVCFLILTALVASTAAAGIRVHGSVTGAEGAPMPLAIVFLTRPNDTTSLGSATADAGGSYALAIDSPGIWVLRFTGVGHREELVAVAADSERALEVNVALGSYTYLPDFHRLAVVGTFNLWRPLNAVPMAEAGDGLYRAEIPSSADTIAYRLEGVSEEGPMEGTQADRYAYSSPGEYSALVHVESGKASIVFDPRKLPPAGTQASVAFGDTGSTAARFAGIIRAMQQYHDEYGSAVRAAMLAGRQGGKVSFDWTRPLQEADREIRSAPPGILRSAAALSALTLSIMAKRADAALCTRSLDAITPASRVWAFSPHAIAYALTHASWTEAQQDHYVQALLESNPDVRIRTAVLLDEFMEARLSDRQARAGTYYDILIGQYGSSREAETVRKAFTSPNLLRPGSPIPPFAVALLDDSTRTISDSSLRGRCFLVDFWSSTDRASLRERELLHAAYRRFHAKGFTILSISLDQTRTMARHFLRGKESVPWLSAYVGKNRNDPTLRAFQVVTLPQEFLVDPHGILLARGADLLGDGLTAVLEQQLGK